MPKVTGPQIVQQMAEPKPQLIVFVAETDGALVGAILLEPYFSTWRGEMGFFIIDLYVHAAHRGGRIGERLVSAAAAQARRNGYGFLKLDVESGNAGAKRFYSRLGFSGSSDEVMFLENSAIESLLGGPATQ